MNDAVQAKAMLDGLLKVGKPEPRLMTEAETIAACNTYPSTGFVDTPRMEVPLPIGSVTKPMEWMPGEPVINLAVPAEPPATDDVRDNQGAHTHTPGEFTKEQIKQATDLNPDLAKLVGKKGRKSAAQQAEINALVAQALGVTIPGEFTQQTAEPIGLALKGATAEELAAALAATTTPVVSTPEVEVRVLMDEGTRKVNEMPSFLSADTGFADLAALSAAAATQQPAQQTIVSAPVDPPAELTNEALYQKISDYANNGAGLGWYKNVVDQGGGHINQMPREHMLKVLANPEAFYPAVAQ